MEKTTDLISYLAIFEIVYKNRFILVFFFVAYILISTLLIFLIPVNYSVSGLYSIPSRGYFSNTGEWVQQPLQTVESVLIKFNRIKNNEYERCESKIWYAGDKASIQKIDDQIFEVEIIDSNLECAKSRFEQRLSLMKQNLIANEEKIVGYQNSLLAIIKSPQNSKSHNEFFMSSHAVHASAVIIPFSEVIAPSIKPINNDWVKIYKYGLIAELIVSFLYVILLITKKVSRASHHFG